MFWKWKELKITEVLFKMKNTVSEKNEMEDGWLELDVGFLVYLLLQLCML